MTTTSVAPPVVSGTTSQPASSSSSSSSAAAASALATQQIAGNFQSFLTLLTTQLQNQNPLDPLDTNQFTQQLVESLQQTAQSTQALGFVGKTAVVNGNTAALTNSSATWDLSVPANSNLSISITSSTGQTVFTGSYAANAGNSQPFTWNGQGNDGTQYPDGQYKLTATAADSAGNNVAIATQIQGVVSSVDLTQSPPLLSINGQTYTVSQIQSITN